MEYHVPWIVYKETGAIHHMTAMWCTSLTPTTSQTKLLLGS